MTGKQPGEHLAPRRVCARELDRHHLAAAARLHGVDQPVPSGRDDVGLSRHLLPQIAEIVAGDGQTVGPLRIGVDLVGDRERLLRRDLRRGEQSLGALPDDTIGRLNGFERTRQCHRGDCGGDRTLIGGEMRIESLADRVGGDVDRLLRRVLGGGLRWGLGLADRRRRVGHAPGHRRGHNSAQHRQQEVPTPSRTVNRSRPHRRPPAGHPLTPTITSPCSRQHHPDTHEVG